MGPLASALIALINISANVGPRQGQKVFEVR
jgi:hypothetical protein